MIHSIGHTTMQGRISRNQREVIHPDVRNWVKRCINNGQVHISNKTLYAVNNFYVTIKNKGILKKIKSMCCFVPDGLIAATTPIVKLYGSDPWTNVAFTSSDLNIDGLKSNGTTKYLKTGVIQNVALPTLTSGGYTLYTTTAANEDVRDIGCYDNSNDGFGLMVSWSDQNCYFDCWSPSIGRISANNSLFKGYLSGNRTGNTFTVYKASSTVKHVKLVSGSGANGIGVPHQIWVFGINYFDSDTVITPPTKRYSFVAIHDGLSDTESSAFFDAIHKMRKEIGGGFV